MFGVTQSKGRKLPRLKTLGRTRQPLTKLRVKQAPRNEPLPQIPVAFPFSSQLDVWVVAELQKIDWRWQAQYQVGNPWYSLNMRPEAIHHQRKIVLYVDGIAWHRRIFKTAHDIENRAPWRRMGYRVVEWEVQTLEELKKNFYWLYRRDIG